MSDVFLILENGQALRGKQFGYDGEATGALVFTTGMTGYLETLADPAHYGQIVIQTFPLVGNYGVISDDFGSGAAHLKAYIVREWCQEPSNFRSEGSLDSFLCEKKIPGLYDIDTRKLTRILREHGSMNAMISKTEHLTDAQLKQLRDYKITDAVASASAAGSKFPKPQAGGALEDTKDAKSCVKVWNLGASEAFIDDMVKSGLQIWDILSYDAKAEELLADEPGGIVITSGPGDPGECMEIVEEIKKLCSKNIPILAYGLGHQLLALANGAKTEKMKFGHHGANQAVKEVGTTAAFITTQNHGYVVDSGSLPPNAKARYINVNDGTCEGIEYSGLTAISVQFNPTREIFAKFKQMMEGECSSASK